MSHVADLSDDVLTSEQLAALLKISDRTLRDRRAMKSWPFSPIAGFPAKGKAARYSKAQVLAIINGQTGRTPRLSQAS